MLLVLGEPGRSAALAGFCKGIASERDGFKASEFGGHCLETPFVSVRERLDVLNWSLGH